MNFTSFGNDSLWQRMYGLHGFFKPPASCSQWEDEFVCQVRPEHAIVAKLGALVQCQTKVTFYYERGIAYFIDGLYVFWGGLDWRLCTDVSSECTLSNDIKSQVGGEREDVNRLPIQDDYCKPDKLRRGEQKHTLPVSATAFHWSIKILVWASNTATYLRRIW